MAWIIESTKKPGLTYDITKFDPKTKRATLVGALGVPFERVLDDDSLTKYGYRVVKKPEIAQGEA